MFVINNNIIIIIIIIIMEAPLFGDLSSSFKICQHPKLLKIVILVKTSLQYLALTLTAPTSPKCNNRAQPRRRQKVTSCVREETTA